jgi:uncharacterized tellurite resistance protein B-like protein
LSTDADLLIGRALIAAAWADGHLDEAEHEALEDLMLEIDDIAPDTWRALHADLGRPFDAEHRARIFADLDDALSGPAERKRAAELVGQMRRRIDSDSEEAAALDALVTTLTSDETGEPDPPAGLFARLGNAFGSGLARHSSRLRQRQDGERKWEESLRSRLARHWPEDEDWPEETDLHRICTGAAILAHVARMDGRIDSGELDALRLTLETQWGLGPAAARLAVEVTLDATAGGLDLHLLLREFRRSTTEPERQRFLAAVFTVAAGDGTASYDEIEEVRRIGRGLLLSHQDFISAKLSVPDARRET